MGRPEPNGSGRASSFLLKGTRKRTGDTKMKNKKTFLFFLGLILLLFSVNSYGSGTYLPPLPASWDIGEAFDTDIQEGKKLFEGSALAGPGGQSCYACHAAGHPVALKRSSLKKKIDQLSSEINECLIDPARSAGSRLEPDSEQMLQLELFLMSLYHLPNESVKSTLIKN